MKRKGYIVLAALLSITVATAEAGKGSSRSSSGRSTAKSASGSKAPTKSHSAISPGTGSKSSSTTVKGHVTKDGTYVAPHKRTTPDSNVRNNYSTKGNTNPYTGKRGTKDVPSGR